MSDQGNRRNDAPPAAKGKPGAGQAKAEPTGRPPAAPRPKDTGTPAPGQAQPGSTDSSRKPRARAKLPAQAKGKTGAGPAKAEPTVRVPAVPRPTQTARPAPGQHQPGGTDSSHKPPFGNAELAAQAKGKPEAAPAKTEPTARPPAVPRRADIARPAPGQDQPSGRDSSHKPPVGKAESAAQAKGKPEAAPAKTEPTARPPTAGRPAETTRPASGHAKRVIKDNADKDANAGPESSAGANVKGAGAHDAIKVGGGKAEQSGAHRRDGDDTSDSRHAAEHRGDDGQSPATRTRPMAEATGKSAGGQRLIADQAGPQALGGGQADSSPAPPARSSADHQAGAQSGADSPLAAKAGDAPPPGHDRVSLGEHGYDEAWHNLTAAQRQSYIDSVYGTSLPGTPDQAAAAWEGLQPMERQAWIHERAGIVGNTDGIPAVDRDTANRVELPKAISDMESRIQSLEAAKPPPSRMAGALRGAWRKEVESQTEILNGYKAVEQALRNNEDRQLFLMALAKDGNGRAIIAVNNPDTATDVATFIPGTGAKLTGISKDLERSDDMHDAALYAGSPSASVIIWHGYDAPQSLAAASRAMYARNGARPLRNFQNGLRAAHHGPPSHNTLIGHSYGTTVIGTAAKDSSGINADDIALVASPGVRAGTASRLKITGVPDGEQGQHVYATTARGDVIRFVPRPVHGRQPVTREFGAQNFESAPGGWNWIRNHGAYWNLRNPALFNVGRIIAGRGKEVSR